MIEKRPGGNVGPFSLGALHSTVMGASVLFVCMGNICRSPTAEGVFRALVAREAPGWPVHVDSAGTHAYHVGEPPDRRSVAAAAARGYDLSGLRARQVIREDFERFDLLLAMDGDNLARLHALAPSGLSARACLLLDYAPHQPLRHVPDPYYGGPRGFEQVLDLIEEASRGVLAALQVVRDQGTAVVARG